MQRTFLAMVACVSLHVGCAQAAADPPRGAQKPPPPANLDERVARLHRGAIVVDTHNDITSAIADEGFDLGKPTGKTHTDLPRMKSGGVSAEFFSIYVDRGYAEQAPPRGGSTRRALDMIDATYQQLERHPEDLSLAVSVADIRRAKTEGKIAVLMGIEGGHAIENSLRTLREMYRLGVRYMTLTHTNTNDWADSAGWDGPPDARHHGLSDFGEEVVREMQRIGMLVDVSHVSDETFDDVMRVARAPVIASHSSARAICPHRRNMSDDMLRAMAKNGGVVMVNFSAGFLDASYMAASSAFQQKNKARFDQLRVLLKDDRKKAMVEIDKLRAEFKHPRPKLDVLIDHIEHVAKIAGIDHVGLGSDFDGVPALPDGLDGIGDLPKITRALLARGYTDEQVTKVLGGNFLRVFELAERFARGTKSTLSGDGNTRMLTPALED